MLRATGLLLLGLLVCPATSTAQFWDFVHRVLNGDTSAGPDHDTTYILSYRDNLTLSAVSSYQGSTIDLRRKDGDALSYRTNTPAQYGLGLDYKWLSLEATFTIEGLSTVEEGRGPTQASGLGFGFTGRSWWFRNFFRNTQGFHPADSTRVDSDWSEGDPYPYRSDVRNITYMAAINHGFNARRFSYNAAIWQMERQLRSAGSWIAGATFWYSETQWDKSLIPTFDVASYEATTVASNAGRTWVWSITGGYTYTACLWKRGFVNALLVPGVGARQVQLDLVQGGATETGWQIAGTAEVRIGTGYMGDRWYAALTANSFQNTGPIPPDVRFGTSFVNARLTAGWRFRNIKPLWPRVGL